MRSRVDVGFANFCASYRAGEGEGAGWGERCEWEVGVAAANACSLSALINFSYKSTNFVDIWQENPAKFATEP